MSGFVDSHCHLSFDPLNADVPAVLARASDAGVEQILCVSVSRGDVPNVLDIATRHPDMVWASVGVHPNDAPGADTELDEDALVALAAHPRVVAIGETGLDYFRATGDVEWQRDRFRAHIGAAKRTKKPIIVHTREASADTLEILRAESARDAGGVMHCFTESWDVAQAALDLGFYISFSGIVTFRTAENLRDVARRIPDDRLLIETDAPYLAPVPYRGKSNEPAWVAEVARCLAGVRGISLEELGTLTSRNFRRMIRVA